MKYAEAKQALGCSDSTLRNIVLTCHKIPKEKRRAELSFTHHQETAKLKCNMEQREALLQKAVDAKMLCKDFRIYCRKYVQRESSEQRNLHVPCQLNDPAFAMWQEQIETESTSLEVCDFLNKLNELEKHPIWKHIDRLSGEETEKIGKYLDLFVVAFREKLNTNRMFPVQT